MDLKLKKIIYAGDFNLCHKAKRRAVDLLTKLYQSLDISDGMQGWRPLTPIGSNAFAQLHIGLTCDTIVVYAGDAAESAGVQKAAESYKKCPCTCNMSLGMVASRVLSGTDIYAAIGLKEAPFYIYSVNICQSEFTYVAFENIIGSDFTPWELGQKVIVMAYNKFLFGCCLPDPSILGENFEEFTAKGCLGVVEPISDVISMRDYYWRTTYRILQIDALPFDYWKEYNE
jgi:hypothetical protein